MEAKCQHKNAEKVQNICKKSGKSKLFLNYLFWYWIVLQFVIYYICWGFLERYTLCFIVSKILRKGIFRHLRSKNGPLFSVIGKLWKTIRIFVTAHRTCCLPEAEMPSYAWFSSSRIPEIGRQQWYLFHYSCHMIPLWIRKLKPIISSVFWKSNTVCLS